ncbi:hypothetical protein Pcinc_030145 [Petrolisthes cinctipes]|uniref:Uncharacterized protein n=1 Tax=Petrolisthes cinctipes TaxID=88211 RepID=A0AAE1K4W7_PETCI|nr:hypothetical protein Pcinc_030145 [Petrolisthes cinctipes]
MSPLLALPPSTSLNLVPPPSISPQPRSTILFPPSRATILQFSIALHFHPLSLDPPLPLHLAPPPPSISFLRIPTSLSTINPFQLPPHSPPRSTTILTSINPLAPPFYSIPLHNPFSPSPIPFSLHHCHPLPILHPPLIPLSILLTHNFPTSLHLCQPGPIPYCHTTGPHPILPHHHRAPSHIATPPQGPIPYCHTTTGPHPILPHHHRAPSHIATPPQGPIPYCHTTTGPHPILPHHHRTPSHIATPPQGPIPYCNTTTGPQLIATPPQGPNSLPHHQDQLPPHKCPSLTPLGPITTSMPITHTTGPPSPSHHSHHRALITLTSIPIIAQGPITLTSMSITHTTGPPSPSHQFPSLTPQAPPPHPHINSHHSTGLHQHNINVHHSHHWAPSPHQCPSLPLGTSTILRSNNPVGPHHHTTRLQWLVTIHTAGPTTTVLEPTATPMPIAASLGPITIPCFITIHTTTGTNIHTNAQPHHCAPSLSTSVLTFHPEVYYWTTCMF